MTKKTVLVTGGAKRLGACFCRTFADAGWHVVIHYNSSSAAAEALLQQLPSAEIVQCDLADPQAGADMISALARRLTDWRCLINSASIFPADPVTALDPVSNAQSMQINAASPALMAQTFLAEARSKGGRRVIQVTDQKLRNLNPDFFSYTMSKAAADIAARMMAMATQPDDRVYQLAPGAILASHDQTEDEADRSHLRNPLKRRTTADDVADAALFLANGRFQSGQTICVDSGQNLLRQPRDVIYMEREGCEA